MLKGKDRVKWQGTRGRGMVIGGCRCEEMGLEEGEDTSKGENRKVTDMLRDRLTNSKLHYTTLLLRQQNDGSTADL